MTAIGILAGYIDLGTNFRFQFISDRFDFFILALAPYTFADDLAQDMAHETDKRSAEEVLISLIEGTGDDKLTSFAVRLALAGHRGIPRDGELDFLAEAEAAFLTPKPKKSFAAKKKEPTPIKPAKAAVKKAKYKPTENAVAA